MAATIKPIDESSVHQIQSGQVIVDLCSAVKELVENSIDSGCNSIGLLFYTPLTCVRSSDVRFKNQGLDLIEVQDNGSGISPANYAYVALKHHTSKLSSFSDLASLQSFGFRGEALASLCALSRLVITTCVQADVPKGSRLSFDTSGVLTETAVVASHRGTTVSVNGLFQNLPVRRRELERNIKREWLKVCALLHQYACIQTKVKFSVSQQPSRGNRTVLFSTRGNATTRENIMNIFGTRIISGLIPVDLSLNLQSSTPNLDSRDVGYYEGRLVGYVSRPSSRDGRHTPDRQMLFVNGRPCSLPRFVKTFNEVYRSYNSSQSPFIFVDLRLDTHRYDVNVSPDKLSILLHDQSLLLKGLRTSLDELFSSHQGIMPVSQTTHGSQRTKDEAKMPPLPKKLSFIGSDQSSRSINDTLSSDDELLPLNLADSNTNVEEEVRQDGGSDERQVATDPRNKGSSSPRLDKSWKVAWTPASLESDMNEGQAKTRRKLQSTQVPNVVFHGSRTGGLAPFHAKSYRNQRSLSDPRENSKDRPFLDCTSNSDLSSMDCDAQNEAEGYTAGGSNRDSRPPPVESLCLDNNHYTGFPIPSPQLCTLEVAGVTQSREVVGLAKDKPSLSTGGYEPANLGRPTAVGGNSSGLSSDSANVQDARAQAASGRDHKCSVFDDTNNASKAELEDAVALSSDDADGGIPIEDQTHAESLQDNNLDQSRFSGRGEKSKRLEDGLGRDSQLSGTAQRVQTTEEHVQSRMRDYLSGYWVENDNMSMLDTAEDNMAPDAESQLTVTIARDHFSRMRVVGQFNKGFIIAVRPATLQNMEDSRARHDELFIIDQHASDEKYNFERLQSSTIVQSQALVVPKSLRLTALEEEILSENLAAVEANGFKVRCDASQGGSVGSRCQLLALPLSRETTFDLGDLEELITLLGDEPSQSGYIPRPSKVRKMFAMRACRGSVMIGQALTPSQMATLVKQMGELDKPWNCPHGRPTMRHLCQLCAWESKSWKADLSAPVLSSWISFLTG
ncbi:hypothetical protein L249_8133 [Ophiocordyceps polyrhachis-furcata BCC 54312]|uniref:DNA mismatch repair protein PMS1 n=1 Tax=Ophiocordyceps polyrhachis-furcata BCC 54312 TaxID=1330021 RepID=A0A367LHZ5_9HYPO|nr:hypothetical protein L249_8133 [Ophiocordyceps polyrhachis-furcata BCC 54312]